MVLEPWRLDNEGGRTDHFTLRNMESVVPLFLTFLTAGCAFHSCIYKPLWVPKLKGQGAWGLNRPSLQFVGSLHFGIWSFGKLLPQLMHYHWTGISIWSKLRCLSRSLNVIKNRWTSPFLADRQAIISTINGTKILKQLMSRDIAQSSTMVPFEADKSAFSLLLFIFNKWFYFQSTNFPIRFLLYLRSPILHGINRWSASRLTK